VWPECWTAVPHKCEMDGGCHLPLIMRHAGPRQSAVHAHERHLRRSQPECFRATIRPVADNAGTSLR
jgi:hypothetical protein